MDRIDRAILGHLMHGGRLSNTELADRVGLSPSPCLRRVRNLERAGVIAGYRAAPGGGRRGPSASLPGVITVSAQIGSQDMA
jgi:Lrp/AsnC family transcriptional regulator, leucine-responsive regulatory protein